MARKDDDRGVVVEKDRLGPILAILLALLAIVIVVLSIVQYVASIDEPAETTRGAGGVEYVLADYFVQDQFIVRGPVEAVNEAIAGLEVEGLQRVKPRLITQIAPDRACPGLSNNLEQFRELAIDLYSFTPSRKTTVASIIRDIEDRSAGQVDAEFNWISGSPWEIEGSPWEIEGSTITPAMVTDAREDFVTQWAWQAIGLDSPARIMDTEPRPRVRVGVFDTSPFTVPEGTLTEQTIPWVKQPVDMSLDVLHPESNAPLEADSESGRGQDHGLFVAGLIYAIAPNSDIRLIRVLGNNNKGNLYTLIEQVFNFIEDVNDDKRIPGAVMNLSLGLRLLPGDAEDYEDLSRQVELLRDLSALARCSGIVVVAAAGNDSSKLRIPWRASSPADWSSVIGVAAGNQSNARSCFSNQGDIAAPGGEGLTAIRRTPTCEPNLKVCPSMDSCPYGVIGPVYKENETDATGFGYWAGTSFAAPMVSGLAARVLEEGDGNLTPADVRAIIECGATRTGDPNLGAGIINVQRTLDECIPPLAPPEFEQGQ